VSDEGRALVRGRLLAGVAPAAAVGDTAELLPAELRAARRRIRELETDLVIIRQAARFLGEDRPRPKGSTR
jgi:hypothetical protein